MSNKKQAIIFPQEVDYPQEIFRYDVPVEYQVGCAKAYYKTNFITRRLFIKRIEETVNLLPNEIFKKTLDVGTGAGFILPMLSSVSEKVYAMDLSRVLRFVKPMLDKRRINNVYLSFGDVTCLPYKSNSFDLIVCLSLIEHVQDLKRAYGEMSRVLRKDGILILGYPIENQVHNFLRRLLKIEGDIRRKIKGIVKPIEQRWFHPHVSTFDDIEKEAEHFFRVEATINVGFALFNLYRILKLKKKVKPGGGIFFI